jgi:antitoxin HicB
LKRAERYLEMPYHYRVVRSELEGGAPGWVAAVEEFDGCIAQGDTPEELMENIGRAMLAWVSAEVEVGHPIPGPKPEKDHSGQFRVRLPRGLHAALAKEADCEGVSLNQLVVGLLAGGIGWRAGGGRAG